MSKSKKSDKDKAIALSQEESRVHSAHKERPHIALELEERGLREEAESLTKHLLPWARNSAHGAAKLVEFSGNTRWDGKFQYAGFGRHER